MFFYPKFLMAGRRKINGGHAAPGRQVSTWAHATKNESVS
jgi:hypothetical protein